MTTLETAAKAAREKYKDTYQRWPELYGEWSALTDAERTDLILAELAANLSEGMVEAATKEFESWGPRFLKFTMHRLVFAALMAAVEEK